MKKTIAVLLIIALALTSFTGCAKKDESIKIGIVTPLTGGQASFGEAMKYGAEMAAKDINDAGGVLGSKLELVIEDDASQAAQSATAATKLITKDKVACVVGTNGSGGSLAIIEVADEYGIPYICPGGSSPMITGLGSKWVSRTLPDDNLQARILIKYAKEELGLSKVGFLYSNDDYGKGGYNIAVEAAKNYGVEFIAETFPSDEQNFAPLLTKMRDAGVEALMLWCLYTPGALLCKQMNEMGWEVPTLASPGLYNNLVFELSNYTCDGVVMTTANFGEEPDSEAVQFAKRYTETYKIDPILTSYNTYDTIMLLAEAIERAGSTEPEKLQAEIRNTKDYPSLKGPITINKDTGEFECQIKLIVANPETCTFDFLKVMSLD